MKKLNSKSAKLIGEKYFKKIKGKIEQDFIKTHSEAVVMIAAILAKKFKADVSAVTIAGWVHDIGRTIESENHPQHSVALIEKEGFKLEPIVKDCIINHSSHCKPQTKEGKILQASDKLSILSIPVLKYFLQQKNILSEDVEFIEKMTTGANYHFKNLSLWKK
jgi:putative nucleotidyltransferase with HDIG domain